jgi:archaemetzincin
MNLIYLLPIGSIEDEVLSVLEQRLHQVLGWEIRRSVPLQMPVTAFNAVRQQYEALQVMRAVADVVPSSAKCALGIIQEDLSIPMLTFVFGQAQLQGRVALMSLARLRQEFYGLPANKELMMTRTVKEALHELGHTFGLIHCPTPSCLMTLANDVQHVDKKESAFCGGCSVLLKDTLREFEMNEEKEVL